MSTDIGTDIVVDIGSTSFVVNNSSKDDGIYCKCFTCRLEDKSTFVKLEIPKSGIALMIGPQHKKDFELNKINTVFKIQLKDFTMPTVYDSDPIVALLEKINQVDATVELLKKKNEALEAEIQLNKQLVEQDCIIRDKLISIVRDILLEHSDLKFDMSLLETNPKMLLNSYLFQLDLQKTNKLKKIIDIKNSSDS